jgi:archaellum biogenesis protein FlaJ (TadC family)
MDKLIKIKAVKIALIVSLIVVFGISLLPMFSPIMKVIRIFVGSIMIGVWTGKGIVNIWYK